MTQRRTWLALTLGLVACTEGVSAPSVHKLQQHSSALAISADGARLYVAHPDADSVSVVGIAERRVLHETLLAASAPARDADQRYEPSVSPRALALDAAGERLYVTGQRAGRVYALDASTAKLEAQADVCSEPIGILVSPDGQSVFVACSQDAEVVQLRARDLTLRARIACPQKPWALAWAPDGRSLLATHLLGPGVSRFSLQPFALDATWTLPPGPPVRVPNTVLQINDATQPHGEVRGIYDVAVRPGSSEVWIAHLMLGTDTPQPELDFERSAFPALSILSDSGEQLARLSVSARPGDRGAFGDVVSGPHALAFTDDGKLAFVVDQNSEDVLIVDTTRRVQVQLVRPLPGHMPEAAVWAEGKLYVQERNTEDVAVFEVDASAEGVSVHAQGTRIATLRSDPMPSELRLGQKLFYSANSDDVPITQNHWMACASCHVEGRSDAVTWQFEQGPRDTPSNAGGMLDTGFLFRTADRTAVQDYWRTINIEQGGHFDGNDAAQAPLLDAIAEFVNYAIPTPIPPSSDLTHSVYGDELSALRERGAAVFDRMGCADCHSGPAKTDSGADNPALDLSGPVVSMRTPGGVLLHDVGTCASGERPDMPHTDRDNHPRTACAFDTPQLRGLADSAPYLHDGSAATLADTLPSMLKASTHGVVMPLSADDETVLIEYLRGL